MRRRNALDVLGELLSVATRATDVADSLLRLFLLLSSLLQEG